METVVVFAGDGVTDDQRSGSPPDGSGTGGGPGNPSVGVPVEALAELTAERLEEELRTLAGHLASATASFLMLVGEYEARGAWDWEALSCAHWLSWRCGVGMVAAREQVRVARALRGLPLVSQEFLAGRLSYSKVRAITRVAHGYNEEALVQLARSGTAAHVDRACSALSRCQDQDEDDDEIRAGEDRAQTLRSLAWSRDDRTGELLLRARVPAEEGEALLAAINAAADRCREAVTGSEAPPTMAQRRVDGLVDLSRHYLASPPSGASCGSQPEIVVHVDATALAGAAALTADATALAGAAALTADPTVEGVAPEAVEPAIRCRPEPGSRRHDPITSLRPAHDEMEGLSDPLRVDPLRADPLRVDPLGADPPRGALPRADLPAADPLSTDLLSTGPLSVWPILTGRGQRLSEAVLQRLTCDAGTRLVVRLPDGTELDAAPHRRTPGRALRRWLLRRDGGCRFPGCGRRYGLHAHHIVHWEHGGPTIRENLIMLCPKHHRAVHEGGWTLTGPATAPEFRRPDDRHVPEQAPVLGGTLAAIVDANRRHGRDIAADGAGGTWTGEAIDWDCFFAAFANGPRAVRPTPPDRCGSS